MKHEEGVLSEVLREFATTLVTDFSTQDILDHLVERIVDVLPVTAAGITLISPEQAPRFVAASDEAALRFERMQTEIWEGPCLLAFDQDEPVSFPDLGADDRIPRFAAAAVDGGLAAVFAFPLRHGQRRLGALDLYRSKTGSLDDAAMSAAQTLADVAAAYLLNAESRNERAEAIEVFRHGALHDPLTGLSNRRLLQERLQHAGERATRSQTSAAVVFADLDRFKQVNDVYGHHVGDELLIAVARRLTTIVRPGDTLARLAGDEFVLLCEDLRDPADVATLTQRIAEAFSRPFEVAGRTLSAPASVGVVFAGPGEQISEEMVVMADRAMYEVKRKGVVGHHTVELGGGSHADRQPLGEDLRTALADDDLHLAYQPIFRTSDGSLAGVEALLRWTHPERGPVSANLTLAIAEESDLIDQLETWVLERSCRDRSSWIHDRAGAALDLSVNVSTNRLLGRDLPGAVARALAVTGMDPRALIIEVREDALVADGDRALTVLTDLSALGVRLALEDFGTGGPSLHHLGRLPIDMVKIVHRSLVGTGRSSSGQGVVEALTGLAHALDLAVVATWVETEDHCAIARSVGSDYYQGNFCCPPLSAPAVVDLLGAAGAS